MSSETNHGVHGTPGWDCDGDDRAFRSLIDQLRVALNEDCANKVVADPKITEAVERALSDEELRRDLLTVIFPNECPTNVEFFERLVGLQRLLGASPSTTLIIGRVWSAAMPKSEPHTCEAILNAFANLKSHRFSVLLESLHFVVGEHQLRPAFAAHFLTSVTSLTAGDFAGGIFLGAVRTFCERHASVALTTLWILYNAPNDTRLPLAAFILGSLRKLPLPVQDRDEFERISNTFREHSKQQFRTTYNLSWATTAWQNGITATELQDLIAQHDAGTSDEKNDMIGTFCRIVVGQSMSRDVANRGLLWLRNTVNGSISSSAKYCVAQLVAMPSSQAKSDDAVLLEEGSDLLLAIQPIPVEDMGTWRYVESHLGRLIVSDVSRFNHVFYQFARGDPWGLHQVISQPRGLVWLVEQMRGKDVSDPVGRLLLFTDTACRRLGIQLFDKLAVESIPPSLFDAAGCLGLRVVFHEMQREMLHGDASVAGHNNCKKFKEHGRRTIASFSGWSRST